ncbi:MAG: B12-binding domain-containing radical SAM protein [Clostridiaceae bacterium]
MKLLLVRAESSGVVASINLINLEPLELEYLYTAAREEKVNCEILDCLFDERSLEETLKSFNPDMVAITGYITQEPMIIQYSRIIKNHDSNIKVMVGGVHAEVNYKRLYVDTIDFIVRSSSLEPFKELIKLVDNGYEKKLGNIAGICYRMNGSWYENKPLSIDPDKLPIPDRSHFNENKDKYRYLGFTPCAIVKTAFSCPYQCNFCFCRKVNNGHYAARSIEKVVEEIEGIDCDNIHIVDDTFLLNIERVNRFIELIKENGIKKNYIFYSRADFIVNNEKLIGKLAAIGTKAIIVGLEAIDDSALDSYTKATSKDFNEQCVNILKKYHIDCIALFIVNIDDTKEDFNKLYKWIKDRDLHYSTVSIFTPVPGTDIYHQYKDEIITDNIEHWDFLHLVLEPRNMSRKAFYLEFYKLTIKIALLGKKKGVYDYIDINYIMKAAGKFVKSVVKSL